MLRPGPSSACAPWPHYLFLRQVLQGGRLKKHLLRHCGVPGLVLRFSSPLPGFITFSCEGHSSRHSPSAAFWRSRTGLASVAWSRKTYHCPCWTYVWHFDGSSHRWILSQLPVPPKDMTGMVLVKFLGFSHWGAKTTSPPHEVLCLVFWAGCSWQSLSVRHGPNYPIVGKRRRRTPFSTTLFQASGHAVSQLLYGGLAHSLVWLAEQKDFLATLLELLSIPGRMTGDFNDVALRLVAGPGRAVDHWRLIQAEGKFLLSFVNQSGQCCLLSFLTDGWYPPLSKTLVLHSCRLTGPIKGCARLCPAPCLNQNVYGLLEKVAGPWQGRLRRIGKF